MLEMDVFQYLFDLTLLSLEGEMLNKKFYSNLNQYIEDHTVFHDLNFEYLNSTFKILFLVELIAYVLFAFEIIIHFVSRAFKYSLLRMKYSRIIRKIKRF